MSAIDELNPRSDLPAADNELDAPLARFTWAFERVFHSDWEWTRDALRQDLFISRSGTFLAPGVKDESANWGNRYALLCAYRDLCGLMNLRGIKPVNFSYGPNKRPYRRSHLRRFFYRFRSLFDRRMR